MVFCAVEYMFVSISSFLYLLCVHFFCLATFLSHSFALFCSNLSENCSRLLASRGVHYTQTGGSEKKIHNKDTEVQRMNSFEEKVQLNLC